MKIRVTVSGCLVADAFKTGFSMKPTVVSAGLPFDADLHSVKITDAGDVEFTFISETPGDDCDVSIELTTMRDAIPGRACNKCSQRGRVLVEANDYLMANKQNYIGHGSILHKQIAEAAKHD